MQASFYDHRLGNPGGQNLEGKRYKRYVGSFERHLSPLSLTSHVGGAPAKAECGGDKRTEEDAQFSCRQ
ncbi:hypothetical protein ABIF65_007916 [Bradyrhizobium japonicum]